MRKSFCFFSGLLVTIGITLFIAGCGVSESSLTEAEKRIENLKNKGIPDSSLSRAIVFLKQTEYSKKHGNRSLAKKSLDSTLYLVAKAEEKYEKDMTRLRPLMNKKVQKYQEVKKDFEGAALKRLDSITTRIDSFINLDWLLNVEHEANRLDSIIPHLKDLQDEGDELKSKIIGRWVCTQKTTHSQDKSVNAVQKKTFIFNNNNNAQFINEKSGKSSPFLKENWKFVSKGTFDVLGDTIFLTVDSFSRVKEQVLSKHKSESGKIQWENDEKTPYDSVITDGSQDRWITFEDLKEDFSHR